MKKILYVITKSNYGGAQRYVHELACSLSPERYESSVACGGNGTLVTKLREAHIPVYTIQNFERDIHILKEVRATFELFQIIRAHKPDIVHLNSSKAGGVGALIARLCGVKRIIFTAHGWPFNEPRNLLWRAIVWLLSYITVLLSHHTITVSRFDYMHSAFPFLKERISYIPNRLPYIPFKSKGEARLFLTHLMQVTQNDSSILWIGTIGEYVKNKNLLLAIQSVERLIASGTRCYYFIIGANGGERARLQEYIEVHGLTDSVFLTGFIDSAREYLLAFDIFVLPSLKEGLPYALLEAGQAKIATIASNVGGIPEIIENGVSGILIHPQNEHELLKAMKALANNEELRNEYAQRLNDSVVAKYGGMLGTVTMRDQTMQIYESKTSFAS